MSESHTDLGYWYGTDGQVYVSVLDLVQLLRLSGVDSYLGLARTLETIALHIETGVSSQTIQVIPSEG